MKRVIFLTLQIIVALSIYSQPFVSKKWDARFGGINDDELHAIIQTTDGGYILGGISYSGIGGNKTQPNWDTTLSTVDAWIVKIDGNGNYLWDKRYGGTSDDGIACICPTSDGGYMLGGFTTSDISGDVTQPMRGGADMWVIKVDNNGNKQWDRRFGGSGDDGIGKIRQTKDGGYILGGGSTSPISGDKTQDNRDPSLVTADYWIVKIDSAGNKQWDKRFGSIDEDDASDIILTPDGGYLIGGSSPAADSSFDKTEPNYGQSADNYWIVKIDSLGNKQWDKVYGGANGEVFGNALNIKSGGYLLGGTSYDGISGDKTSDSCGYWLVKIDTAGNKLGDWAYGTGTNCEQTFGSMTNTLDGGYLLTGTSGPVTGGDKTGNNLSQVQVWTIKIDSLMNRVWDKTALTL